jgi:hypothetical protein
MNRITGAFAATDRAPPKHETIQRLRRFRRFLWNVRPEQNGYSAPYGVQLNGDPTGFLNLCHLRNLRI